jgi:hypothetical protein
MSKWRSEIAIKGMFFYRGEVRRSMALANTSEYITRFLDGSGRVPFLPEYFARHGLDFFEYMPDDVRYDIWGAYCILLTQMN